MEWDTSLNTGVAVIDAQHKQLVERVSEFFDLCLKNRDAEAFRPIMRFLEDYVVKHFQCEEEIQNEIKYPRAAEHKAIHDNFVTEFLELKKKLLVFGVTDEVSLIAKKLLVNWIVQHINSEDKDFCKFYKSIDANA